MKFNEKLITFRKEKGWSQEELGNKLNVSRQTISKWELGETTPEMDKLINLSEIFNISIDELIKDQVEGQEEVSEKEEVVAKQKGIYEAAVLVLKVIGIAFLIGIVLLITMIILGMANYSTMTKGEVRIIHEEDSLETFDDFGDIDNL